MEFLQQRFSVQFEYTIYFTRDLFRKDNPVFQAFLESGKERGAVQKMLFVIDDGVANNHPDLLSDIRGYLAAIGNIRLAPEFLILPGGEQAKNTIEGFQKVVDAVDTFGIDRHSYIVGIGGGAVLDVVGYAAAVSHRGIRHIRIPTTVLSQNDSGVGVKNGINYFKKKNFLGTFAPPVAVFNDSTFLATLDYPEWRAGISEAIKVALIKDAAFFVWLENNTSHLVARNDEVMHYLIRRCAELHLQHIAGADPFETGSSRPLDFGHWSAHKLEGLSQFTVRHGDAVALGIALDTVYSCLSGRLDQLSMERVVRLITALGFDITHPLLEVKDKHSPLLNGLNEFREHLGGRLTIMLLRSIGEGEEVNEIDPVLVKKAYEWLTRYKVNASDH
jgi:3-dehydroquinate synthase